MSKNTPHDVESLFEENLGLVYAAYDRLPDTDIKKKYKDDIISEGMRGLEHSIMSLDPDKGHNSTYLYGGIQLAMYNYMRSIKKHNNTYSIDSVVGFNNDGKAVTLEETLEDGSSEDMFTIDDVIDEYVDIVIDQLELLRPEIVIHRITGDPKIDDLIEPTWLVKKFCVLNDIDKEMVRRNTYQGKKLNDHN